MRIRLTPTLVAAALFALIDLPTAAHSQSDVEFKTTNQQAISEYKVGIAHMQYASPDEASTHFAAAVKADPTFGLARVNWAFTANLPTAQRDAEINRGVADAATHGSHGELILATAISELAYGRPNVSAALFRAASLLRPYDRLAEFASMLDLSGKEGIAARREMVKRHPDYAVTYNQLAFELWSVCDRAGALEAAKKQIELDPTASNPHDSYAHLLQWNGDFDAAKAHYLQAVKLPSPYPGSYGGLAEIAALQGKYDDARSYLSQALAASYTPFEKSSSWNRLRQPPKPKVGMISPRKCMGRLPQLKRLEATPTPRTDTLGWRRLSQQRMRGGRIIMRPPRTPHSSTGVRRPRKFRRWNQWQHRIPICHPILSR